eukprot:TRINITY_DN27667_c0_g1_i4.p1 TRINITY_DN27667_c0_g1~~TRINITY_DN27667_c0_g1_i4.p1  ORF type:complete len:270 (-),score=71.36 TRINITY_DN27667_c0_g1_i4:57-866(-)
MGCCGGKHSSTEMESLEDVQDAMGADLKGLVESVTLHPGRVDKLCTLILSPSGMEPELDWQEGTLHQLAVRARLLNRALDCLLGTMVEEVESGVEKGVGWDDVALQEVKTRLEKAMEARAPGTAAAIKKLLHYVRALWDDTLMESKHMNQCHNQSLCKLGGILQVLVSRRVVLESANRFNKMLADWHGLCRILLDEPRSNPEELNRLMCPALNPGTKTTLLYIANVAAKGEAKFGFVVFRNMVLEDGLQEAERQPVSYTHLTLPTKRIV